MPAEALTLTGLLILAGQVVLFAFQAWATSRNKRVDAETERLRSEGILSSEREKVTIAQAALITETARDALAARTDAAESRADHKVMQLEVADIRKANVVLTAQVAALGDANSTLTEKVAGLEKTNTDLTALSTGMNEANVSLSDKIASLEQTLIDNDAAYTEKLKMFESQIVDLQEQVKSLTAALQDKTDELSKLQGEQKS